MGRMADDSPQNDATLERDAAVHSAAPPTRNSKRRAMAAFSTVLALLSLLMAGAWRNHPDYASFFKFLIGFWVLAPPVWFMVDWTYYTSPEEEENVKHVHELGRNIWLALVVILAVLTGIRWPFGD